MSSEGFGPEPGLAEMERLRYIVFFGQVTGATIGPWVKFILFSNTRGTATRQKLIMDELTVSGEYVCELGVYLYIGV